MAYSTCTRVAGLIPNLLNGASNFDSLPTGVPPSSVLRDFMSSGCAVINTKLKSMGYTPPASNSELGEYLAQVEANYAAWQAELTRGSPRVAAGERTRSQMFQRAFEDGLKRLEGMDLSQASIAYDPRWYVGGISEAEKDSVESDTDRVPARFRRGMHANPDAPGTAASSDPDSDDDDQTR